MKKDTTKTNKFSKNENLLPSHRKVRSPLNHIFRAIRNNDIVNLKPFIDEGGYTGEDKDTLLHHAVRDSNMDKARMLIKAGADINAENHKGFAPLHVAIFQSDIKIAKYLITQGANLKIKTPNQERSTFLHYAVKTSGDLKIVKMLVKALTKKGLDIDSRNENDYTPLQLAVIMNRLAIVNFLLEKGADINYEDEVFQNYISYNAIKGLEGEKFVATVLMKYLCGKSYVIFNNVILEGFNQQIDHLVISRFGIFVIETKNYSGAVRFCEHKKHWLQEFPGGARYKFNCPIRQNEKKMKSISKMLGLDISHVHSIVTFCQSNLKATDSTPFNVFGDPYAAVRKIQGYTGTAIGQKDLGDIIKKIKNITREQDSRGGHIRNVNKLKNNAARRRPQKFGSRQKTC